MLHQFTCVVCGTAFEGEKRKRRTCSRTCCASLAGRSPSKRTCECGAPASKRGWCERCAEARQRESKKRDYVKHRQAYIDRARRAMERKPDHYRAMRDLNTDRSRFNGCRKLALERDGYQCQHCGVDKQLVVHHKNRRPSRDEIDNFSTVDDLLTLCRSCHIKLHVQLGDIVAPKPPVRRSRRQQDRATAEMF